MFVIGTTYFDFAYNLRSRENMAEPVLREALVKAV